jgi:hypothetical protein
LKQFTLKFLLQENQQQTNDLIDEAIAAFDTLITKVNAKKVKKSTLQTNQC